MYGKLTVFSYGQLLKSMVHSHSENIVNFEVDVGVARNMQKCNSDCDFLASQAADCSSKLAWMVSP